METQSAQRAPWSLNPRQLLWKLSDTARHLGERRSLDPTAALGKRGEDFAHRYLRSSGFMILARNYRTATGDAEIDIVARDKGITVFVEVKSRATDEHGSPDRAIDSEKRRNIIRAARSYTARAGIEWSEVRFDVVAVVLSKPPSVVHYQDVFLTD
jgi:putative endonuclease